MRRRANADRDLRIRLARARAPRRSRATQDEAADEPRRRTAGREVTAKEAEKAVQVFTKELDPLTDSVKKAVRKAVAKAGEDVLTTRTSRTR
jgi:hypothetical protein